MPPIRGVSNAWARGHSGPAGVARQANPGIGSTARGDLRDAAVLGGGGQRASRSMGGRELGRSGERGDQRSKQDSDAVAERNRESAGKPHRIRGTHTSTGGQGTAAGAPGRAGRGTDPEQDAS